MIKKSLLLDILAFVIVFTFIFSYLFLTMNNLNNSFSNEYYSIKMDTSIRSFKIKGQEYAAKYSLFQTEEDYQLQWRLEKPIRISRTGDTIFTYSQCFTYECYKTFTFSQDSPIFTVQITKVYTKSAASDNNQILFDLKNEGYILNNDSCVFLEKNWKLSVYILSANPSLTMTAPKPTELQFNFNGKSDRDLAFHNIGDIETATFEVAILT